MGDKDFVLAGDGWVQVSPCGEFPHVGAGVTQVIDREACDRIAADFNARKSDAIFPGVLVDFDHFSLDTEKSSEAAGWISDLESRDTGLWARVRWSDAGLSAVREWEALGPPPCICHCSLEEVDDDTANRWSDVARAVSLAVRQAKAAMTSHSVIAFNNMSRRPPRTDRAAMHPRRRPATGKMRRARSHIP